MLVGLDLRNFRGFEDHHIPLRGLTVVVGRNNAGKSTIVEALRLVAIITARYEYLNFYDPPDWSELPLIMRGVSPSLSLTEFDFSTAFHRYSDPPAEIIATFDNRTSIHIYIGDKSAVHAVLVDHQGTPVPDRTRARRLNLPLVAILPQIGPLVHDEEELTLDYIRRTLDTPMASQHFRNQLNLLEDAWDDFAELVSATWPGVRVRELERVPPEFGVQGPRGKARFSLFVQNEDFVAEASRMGHGLQMWLQIMWFLARTPVDASVILDEPDVYMHPDLQRRLLRIVTSRHRQAIVATHSSEIMSDVDPENILVVERARSESGFASSLPAVQQVVDALGGVHNLHLARLWNAKRFLLVEGDDMDLLGPLHATLFPETSTPLQALPHGDVGGWSGWERAVGAAGAMRNAVGEPITVYTLFDCDYHAESLIQERYARARDERIQLHVWSKKEIENYLLIPTAIERFIAERAGPGSPRAIDIARKIDEIAEDLRDPTVAAIVTAIHSTNRGIAAGTAYLQAKTRVESAWHTPQQRWSIVGGKQVLASLSNWSKTNYNVSFSAAALARSLLPAEIPGELRGTLAAIEAGEAIPSDLRSLHLP